LFKKLNDLMQRCLRRKSEASMKDDAFDDVRCPFDYRAQLEAAREALDAKLIECVSRPWGLGYRELAKKFNISVGTLFAIAREHKEKQKPGPRRYTRKRPLWGEWIIVESEHSYPKKGDV
jgi:hypothetical protein